MHIFNLKIAAIRISALFCCVFAVLQTAGAQGYYNFIRAIPEKDSGGAPLAGANTTFADGTPFQPANDVARSSSWAWRTSLGDGGVLSSLGPDGSTPPSNTRELVTTITGLKPGANYSVMALFWSPDDGLWGIRAGLQYANEQRTNTWFDIHSSVVTEASYVPWNGIPSIFEQGGRPLYAALVGTAMADVNGNVRIFVHDFPSGDSNKRVWYNGVAISEVTEAASLEIDFSAPGTQFNRGVRGLAIADMSLNRGEYYVGVPKSLEVSRGSSIRGVSTGLAAEIYDWKTRNNEPRPSTLQFLKYSRDYDAELFMGVNLRGLIEPIPEGGGYRYYDTNVATLAELASDWVRYVNQIVPRYRQGEAITNLRDAAILDSLVWSSEFAGDSWDKLLAPSEPAVPWIKYWEIGNEPTAGVSAYSVTNSFTLKSNDFHFRYAAVAQAIKAENPEVKVGPTMINATREDDQLNAILFDHSLPIDFITYHPYERMGVLDDPVEITRHLGSVHTRQLQFFNDLKRAVVESGRDAEAMEYAATEVNVSYWNSNDTEKEARMAHALGTVETIFSHARLGLIASHYWIWPTHRWDGTPYPGFKAYEKLRDHMGDTLLATYAFRDIRVYATRDSRTGEITIWGLNFSNDEDASVQLNLENLTNIQHATLLRLQDKSGVTTLNSANLSSEMLGGPAINVDWSSSDATTSDFEDFQWNLPAATLSALVIEPGLGPLVPGLIEQDGQKWFSVQFHPLPYASDVRYELLASDDFSTWEVVDAATPGESEWISLSDDQPIGGFTNRFFRVEMIRE